MVTKTCLTVNLAEIDHMGIVHHSNYPIWFESGRRDYLKKAGIPNSRIAALGLFLPLSKLKCDFKSPARFNDKIIVTTSVIYMSCVEIKFEYNVINNKSDRVIATGETEHAWTNRSIEPLNIKKAAPEIFELLKYFAESTGTT
jgi:acyl-CoA thioester hydrolase